ncbi:DegT/DnrJ/EryC1/StrS family aminotransferase [Streptomyces sp. NBC_01478]|uniref:DegT/DnrJ/EryC1/StrS family aminotransferase n=1 Tax=Streptomyces sp. NBC_01478 TaxID=2903882 RepID=UPI003FCEC33F
MSRAAVRVLNRSRRPLHRQAPSTTAAAHRASCRSSSPRRTASESGSTRRRLSAAGTFGDFGCLSFWVGKNVGGLGNAGAVIARDPAQATLLRRLTNMGRETTDRHTHHEIGARARLGEVGAAAPVDHPSQRHRGPLQPGIRRRADHPSRAEGRIRPRVLQVRRAVRKPPTNSRPTWTITASRPPHVRSSNTAAWAAVARLAPTMGREGHDSVRGRRSASAGIPSAGTG